VPGSFWLSVLALTCLAYGRSRARDCATH